MTNESIQVQKPKRKVSYYFINILTVLFTVSISIGNRNWVDEVMFGLIVLIFLRALYSKFIMKNMNRTFEIETHYDKLYSALLALIGLVMIIVSIMNSDFMVKLNLEWINFLIFGLFFIFNAFKKHKSLTLISKNKEIIEIEDYTLLLNSEIKKIQLFNNKMIFSKSKYENYEFRDLNISKEENEKLTSWIKSNLPNNQIQINWNG